MLLITSFNKILKGEFMGKGKEKSSVMQFLENKERKNVFIACVLLMFYITSSQAGLIILQTPMLTKMNMISQFSIVAIAGTIGLSIMTPIGGKIGDIIGRRTTILFFGTLALIGTLGIGLFQNSFNIYLVLRLAIALAQGTLISIPYIIVGQIFEGADVPKKMGILASSVAIGSFTGSWLPGILADYNLNFIAIVYPLLFLVVGMIISMKDLPNIKSPNKEKIDFIGMILLIVLLASLVLFLNYGGVLGWTNIKIIGCFLAFLISLIAFIKVESKLEENQMSPIIPISLFKNMDYSICLIISFTAVYYQSVMLNYGSFAAIEVLGSTIGQAGNLTLPRTVITMVLPMITGAWVGKNMNVSWKPIAICTGLVAIALAPLMNISSSMSIMVLYITFAITGIAESFRGVSITPTAQNILKPEVLATGTAMINFGNTLASLFGAAIGGSLLGYAKNNTTLGIRLVFSSATIVAVIGFLLAVFYVRKRQVEKLRLNSKIKSN